MLKYQSPAAANAVIARNRKLAIVLGDDGLYWVVTLGEAAKLERQGYEVVYLPARV